MWADSYNEQLLNNTTYKKAYERHLKNLEKQGSLRSSATTMIPVAFHFGGNITTDNICCLENASIEQINVLNMDFNALNEDISIFEELATVCDADAFRIEDLSDGLDVEFFIATSNHPPSSGLVEGEYAITVQQESFPNAGSEWAGYLNIFVHHEVFGSNGEPAGGKSPVPGVQNNVNGNGLLIRADVFGGPGIDCSSGTPINNAIALNLGRTGVHEVGHYLGLFHIFNGCSTPTGDGIADTPLQSSPNQGVPSYFFADGSCYTEASNSCEEKDYFTNFMDYTDDEVNVMFTKGQEAVMRANALSVNWKTGTDGPIPDPVDDSLCGPCLGTGDKIISTSQFLEETIISGDLIVKNGATLTINIDVQFSQSSQLIIEPGGKVIVDGATLSKCPDAMYWKGVHVQSTWAVGFNPYVPGEIEMKNGAVIRDAEVGINTKNTYEYSNNTIKHGGGIVTMNNSFVINCTRGIEFSAFGYGFWGISSNAEQSEINGSSIEGCKYGIYSNGNIGAEIRGSYFDNDGYDINASNSSFLLEGNTFNDGVLMESDSPLLYASTVTSNYFFEYDIEILTQGNFERFDFDNNILSNGSGLIVEGDVDFIISNNDFLESFYGTMNWYTGLFQTDSDIRDNYFRNNLDGNVVIGLNDSEYLANCFENSESSDIVLDDNASIRLTQGDIDDDREAGNCFVNSMGILTLSNTTKFDYLILDESNISGDCKQPGTGNFDVIEVLVERLSDDCGSSLPPPSIPPNVNNNGCDCDPSKGECSGEISSIKDDIQLLEDNNSMNYWVKKRELAKLKRCLDKLIKKYVRYLIHNGDLEVAITLLSGEAHLRYRSMAYGLIVNTLDYDRAQIYLNNMTENTQEEIDFKATQYIHLDYLKDIDNYKLSVGDKNNLYTMGNGNNPTSGYARSLYHKLTGERIIIDHQYRSRTRSAKSGVGLEQEEISIFPNPTVDRYITVALDTKERTSDYSVYLYNMIGEVIETKTLNTGNNQIYLGDKSSILFITILKDGEVIKTEKVVRL
ncbi:MAG: hypothetical protein ACJATI_005519 [Halioglobus sp.]|jgi:hypothetical protein